MLECSMHIFTHVVIVEKVNLLLQKMKQCDDKGLKMSN